LTKLYNTKKEEKKKKKKRKRKGEKKKRVNKRNGPHKHPNSTFTETVLGKYVLSFY